MGVARQLASALGLHMFLKVFSFSAGVMLTRSQSSEMRGATFALDLYVNSAIFLATASVRAANARRGTRTSIDAAEGFAFGLVSLVIFVLAALPVCLAHVWSSQPQSFIDAVAGAPAIGVIVGVVVELLAEPWYGIAIAVGEFQRKVLCEGLAVIVRLVIVTAALRTRAFGMLGGAAGSDDPSFSSAAAVPDDGEGGAGNADLRLAASAYALGMVAQGAFIWAFYWWTIRRFAVASSKTGAPEGERAANLESVYRASRLGALTLAQPPRRLFWSVRKAFQRSGSLFRELFGESVLRLVLTEGEKAVMTAKGNLASQGVYDVISSLGALVVRVVFRLWEDFTFAAWSRPDDEDEAASKDDAKLKRLATAASPQRTNKEFVASAQVSPVSTAKWDLLYSMIKLSVHFGALAVTFGPPLAARLLWTLFGGSRTADWTSPAAVSVLVAYVHYIPLLGMNGLLEAFVRATSQEASLRLVKLAMVACSLGYIALCALVLFYLDAGATGLIVANCANLAVRIVVSGYVIESGVAVASGRALVNADYGDWWALRCLPSPSTAIAHALAYVTVRVVPSLLGDGFHHHHHPDVELVQLPPLLADGFVVVAAVVTAGSILVLDESSKPFLQRLLQRRS